MIKSSEKEYEHLKKEVSEIKACITKYLGYIIALGGASGLVFKYAFSGSSSEKNIIFATLVTMFIISFLFDIIWYKFKSHNRHVGYIQLISQELSHIPKDKFDNHLIEKRYLDEYQDMNHPDLIEANLNQDSIFTWEYVMSRFFSSDISKNNEKKFTKSKDKLLNATAKSNFIFKLSNGLKYQSLGLNNLNNIETEFLMKLFFLFMVIRNYMKVFQIR